MPRLGIGTRTYVYSRARVHGTGSKECNNNNNNCKLYASYSTVPTHTHTHTHTRVSARHFSGCVCTFYTHTNIEVYKVLVCVPKNVRVREKYEILYFTPAAHVCIKFVD